MIFIIGVVCVFLCIFVVYELKRGVIERGENFYGVLVFDVYNIISWWVDFKYFIIV